MQIIGKNHEIVQLFKQVNKTNKFKDVIVTDDLEVLNIAYKFNLTIPYLLYSYERQYQDSTNLLLNNLINIALKTYEISDSTYDLIKTKDNHAGIIALINLPLFNYDDLGEFIIVLDRLEIPGNIGTIFRSIDACKATGVIFVDAITKPYNSKLTASSRGTNLIVPSVSTTYNEALQFLLANNYSIYLGEPQLGKNYQEYNYDGKIAIVVGNERYGINEDWYNHKHNKVFIPMAGFNNSLNVGVAASILAYEAAMKRNNFK